MLLPTHFTLTQIVLLLLILMLAHWLSVGVLRGAVFLMTALPVVSPLMATPVVDLTLMTALRVAVPLMAV
jgi:hypothetical protein